MEVKVLKVIKRDGSEERFDPDKIARVVTSAGLKPQDGFMLALEVEKWINALGKDKINSYEIRQKVVELMRKIDVNATSVYTWYEGQKDENLNTGEKT